MLFIRESKESSESLKSKETREGVRDLTLGSIERESGT